MTTFDAVSAHWPRQPKPPKSTQRSKRSRRSHKGSSVNGSPRVDLKSSRRLDVSSPVKVEHLTGVTAEPLPNGVAPLAPADAAPLDVQVHDVTNESDSSDEENPFEMFAMTQASQGQPLVAADVNPNIISRMNGDIDTEEIDEDEIAQRQHERDARQHAEEGARFRATQAPANHGGDESDEYNDEELDELFRRTVMGGWSSNQSTPKKDSTSRTPTSGMSTGGLEGRRQRREARMMEQAGLGDLR